MKLAAKQNKKGDHHLNEGIIPPAAIKASHEQRHQRISSTNRMTDPFGEEAIADLPTDEDVLRMAPDDSVNPG